ncbi:dihydrofolate synthase / folylpolyglutamate synthase [Pelagirhabdus alkalitolerans]|uniref:tetrahydrofolate synthase n=1 Tax=Pelagirhabdus alkalitolerans TaxID=1612202 RepID=A0A1G6HN38_9BACI|nr:folylpolyglutamate synthase/dihydrofolate synthase family protein [Pelagirhabdus alkalitolerans]SDB95614.1 dihydrofolate synthase / folylpolyglutamate synthase [Pelagirhabdus alkalitolerans]
MFTDVEQFELFLDNRELGGIKPGLSRMKRLLKACGSPEKRMRAIHVAGTNGKGSTVTFIKEMLQESGYQVGTFMSPSFTNRQVMMRVNDKPVLDADYLQYANNIIDEIHQLDHEKNAPSPFEIIVAISYQYLAESADVSIIETGMGGTEDATNCVEPFLSVITTIDYDHTAFLGNDLTSIASHKAGIIKKRTSVIVGNVGEEALKTITQVAHDRQSSMHIINKDFQVESDEMMHRYQDESRDIQFELGMKGSFQLHNASLAIRACLIAKQLGVINIQKEAIKAGLAKARLAGRFDMVSRKPLVILDGAHNAASIQTFIETAKHLYPNATKSVIMAAFSDKPIKKMVQQLDTFADSITFTTFDHPRAASEEVLYNLSEHVNKEKHNDWKALIDDVMRHQDMQNVTFVVGSLDFIGKVQINLDI